MTAPASLTLFLAGDVMTGRGIDQILPHPSEPELFEDFVKDARHYVAFAEQKSGRISQPVAPAYPWGEALDELARAAPFARIVNLETSVTTSRTPEPKGINYRMHPANLPCLIEAGIDGCVLANNHVLDFGVPGLVETLDVVQGAGIRTTGAGRDRDEAERPMIFEGEGSRLLVYGVGTESSGVPRWWAATESTPGVAFLDESSPEDLDRLCRSIGDAKKPGDLVVVSIHWGSNWGYVVTRSQRRIAHALIECGVDLVHGHSSHHPRPIEIHRERLVLYGCGDLLNDYEGIEGYEGYRGELALLYLPSLERATGRLAGLRMVPMRIERMRLRRVSPTDARWLCRRLDEVSHDFGTRITLAEDASLVATSP